MGAHYDDDVFRDGLDADHVVEPGLVSFHDVPGTEAHFDAVDKIFWRTLAPEFAKRLPAADRLESVRVGMTTLLEIQVDLVNLATIMVLTLHRERIVGP